MDKYQQLENRIRELEKQMKDFQQSSSIPFNMIKSLEARGFLTNNSIVVGTGTLGVAGEYRLNIPNANIKSVAFVSPIVSAAGETLEVAIVKSATSAGYEIYVQGVATTTFYFIVVLNLDNYSNN